MKKLLLIPIILVCFVSVANSATLKGKVIHADVIGDVGHNEALILAAFIGTKDGVVYASCYAIGKPNEIAKALIYLNSAKNLNDDVEMIGNWWKNGDFKIIKIEIPAWNKDVTIYDR